MVKLALYHFSVRLQVLTFFFLDSKKHFSYAFSHKSKFETVYRFESSTKRAVGLRNSWDFGGSNAVRLNFACQRALLEKALDRMAGAIERNVAFPPLKVQDFRLANYLILGQILRDTNGLKNENRGIAMRIIRFEDERGQVHYGLDERVVQDGVAIGHPVLLKGDLYQGLEPTGEKTKVLRLLAPVVPTNILCIGRNYVGHIKELGNLVPEYPILFIKNNGSINHPGAPIRLPKCQLKGPEVDYEGELAVVIGKAAFNVTEEKALDYVLGFTVGNDVSARHWQRHGGGEQWCRGKGFDTFCPLGPSLVTPDEISDPQRLHIQSRLNGEVMQDSHTGRMIHTVAALISFLSQDTTLLPGTVILTGTPSGVGSGRSPQVFLKDGDVIEVEIEGIGVLRNPVVE